MRRLPPLNALRLFATAAQTESVTRAAELLHLTHGAVSHQLKQLQEHLGVELFTRSGRGLRLTPEAAEYARRISRALDEIADATATLTDAHRKKPLRVSCMPSFAARWLLPRLGDFISRHPDLDVEVQSTARLVDIKGGEADVGLRFGPGPYPGLANEVLMLDWYYPVCAPAFLARHRLERPEHLLDLPLLRSVDETWTLWFRAMGLGAEEPARGPAFDDSSLMLQATLAGQAVALARHALADDDVRAGRLVRPFREAVTCPHAYRFVSRTTDADQPAIAAFRDWLREQAAGYGPPDLTVLPLPEGIDWPSCRQDTSANDTP